MRHELVGTRIRAADVDEGDVICPAERGEPWHLVINVETAGSKVIIRTDGRERGFDWYDAVFVQACGPLIQEHPRRGWPGLLPPRRDPS